MLPLLIALLTPPAVPAPPVAQKAQPVYCDIDSPTEHLVAHVKLQRAGPDGTFVDWSFDKPTGHPATIRLRYTANRPGFLAVWQRVPDKKPVRIWPAHSDGHSAKARELVAIDLTVSDVATEPLTLVYTRALEPAPFRLTLLTVRPTPEAPSPSERCLLSLDLNTAPAKMNLTVRVKPKP